MVLKGLNGYFKKLDCDAGQKKQQKILPHQENPVTAPTGPRLSSLMTGLESQAN